MDANLTAVSQAILALHSSTDQKQRRQADQWLKDFQETPNAWMVANQILTASDSSQFPLECKLFAGQTLKRKVLHDARTDLDQNAQLSLFNALLNFLLQPATPKLILVQLSLALAHLVVLKNCLAQVLESNLASSKNSFLLFLAALPEALDYSDSASRSQFSIDMVKILNILFSAVSPANIAINNDSASTLPLILEALSSFLKANLVSIELLSQFPFVSLGFSALHIDDCLDICSDFISEIAVELKKSSASPLSLQIQQEFHVKMQESSQRLTEMLQDSLSQKSACKLFVDVAEVFLPHLVLQSESLQYLIHGMILCTSIDDLDLVPMTFNFWEELAGEILKLGPTQRPKILLLAYRKLIDVMINHLKYPDDLSSWTAAERDEFRDFRHVMGDVLKDCCRVLGQEETLSIIHSMLMNLQLETASGKWQKVEAVYFALRSLGAVIDTKEINYLPKIMNMIMTPSNISSHPKIQYAGILVIGRYSEWSKIHSEFIGPQLSYISEGFRKEEVSSAAALSLKYLCESCGQLMVPYLNELHPFYISSLQKLSKLDIFELTHAMAFIIKSVPLDQMTFALKSFTSPTLQQLGECSSHLIGSASTESIQKFEECTDLLSIYFKNVNPSLAPGSQPGHPLFTLFESIWPTIESACVKLPHERVFEAVSKLLKTVFISLADHLDPILPSIMQFISNSFEKTKFPCLLWISMHFTKRFSAGKSANTISAFYLHILNQALLIYQSESEVDQDPEAFEDFCVFLSCGFDHFLNLLVPKIPLILHLLIVGLGRYHAIIQDSSLTTIRDFMRCLETADSGTIASVQSELSQYSPHLIENLLSGAIGSNDNGILFPGNMTTSHVVPIIYSLCIFVPSSLEVISSFLDSAQAHYGPEKIPQTTKDNFVSALRESVSNKQSSSLKFALASLGSAFRGRAPRRK